MTQFETIMQAVTASTAIWDKYGVMVDHEITNIINNYLGIESVFWIDEEEGMMCLTSDSLPSGVQVLLVPKLNTRSTKGKLSHKYEYIALETDAMITAYESTMLKHKLDTCITINNEKGVTL